MATEEVERLSPEELKQYKELQFLVEEAGAEFTERQAKLRKFELACRRAHEMAITDGWDATGAIRRQ